MGWADRSPRAPRRVAVLAGSALVAWALWGCGADRARCGGGTRARSIVQIAPGSTFRAAAESLASAGVVRNPALFSAYAKLRGGDREIKAGTYVFVCKAVRWPAVLERLAQGPVERPVTIPEGFALSDIVPLLAKAVGAPPESVDVAVRDTALRRELDVPTESLEGYLFPDTYRLVYGMPARIAVRQLVRRFQTVWEPSWDAQLQRLAMSRHDIVTLASIIEKEARLPEERPVISAVYHNRLRDQMPLQADPTVQYARGQHTARVLYRDLEIDSPYNTYRHRGLPPGPIASPGRASIEAALFPARVPYKFFVAHPDGHHEFRVTFEEHVEARQDVRREQQRSRAPARRER